VKDSFKSVKECLHYWEFCPLCGKRNNVEVAFDECHSLNTVVNNTELQLVTDRETPALIVSLQDNKITFNMMKEEQYSVRLRCKGFHFSMSYILMPDSDGLINLVASKLTFFIKDTKTKMFYNVLSDYPYNQTSIQLSENSNTVQDFKRELVPFDNFDKKYLIKRIRALSFLN
jgi:hypothetical protein